METMPYRPTFNGATLIILEQGKIRTCNLDTRNHWTLGRTTPENSPDISLLSAIAGRKHGEFLIIEDQWFYCDKGSLNGTFYNGRKVEAGLNGRINPVMLKNGDVLRIDYSDFSTPDPRGVWMLFMTDTVQGKWLYYSLEKHEKVIIGRDEKQCNIVQPLPYISAKHSMITALNGNYYISDCDSRDGTWLNGKEVRTPTILKEKDRISICDCHFIFTGNGLLFNEKVNISNSNLNNENVILKVDIKSKKVHNQNGHGWKELIRDIQFEIKAGELTALLGGSGAGKSTLMNCMNGTDQSGVDGTISLFGEDFYQHFERLKCLVGSVPQENVLHDMLSVEEELKAAAILRLPGDTDKKGIKMQVDKTMQELNLTHKRTTQIKKLSGGERKRVNIGIELVADRVLLYLDEPDAGLDPQTKKELFMVLRKLAHEKRKSILVIIHDVSDINLFDRVIMMVKVNEVGRLAYSGSPDNAKKHFGVENLSDAYAVISNNPERFIVVN